MIVTLSDWRPLARNTLRGFATVRLPAGIVLHDCAVHVRGGKAWASPPSRPMMGGDGKQKQDAAGKVQFSPILTFVSRADQDAFSTAIVAAVTMVHPEAFA